ncbi:unnamed protein product [Clonostachys rosea]|uniref:Transcription factor domain-containing protein n=1 Tax=Bionectria ochroleuca TaxID=29856 RepID=A0ABY6TZF4_BIOOC|nr:unnamed protein product [Clonostachys rosea]
MDCNVGDASADAVHAAQGTSSVSRGFEMTATNISVSDDAMLESSLCDSMGISLADVMSLAVGSNQPYGWLPQWDTEINLDSQWIAELTEDQHSTNWAAGFPLNGMRIEPNQCVSGPSHPHPVPRPVHTEPTPDPEPISLPKNFVQSRWHTFSDVGPSVSDTPGPSRGNFEIDDACHRSLADKLRPRVQYGPLPSTAFFRPKDLLQVDLFHGTCVALKLFGEEEYPELDIASLDGQALDVAWKDWARREERKRLVLALNLQDAEISCLLHHEPLLRQPLEKWPRISSEEAFSAPDAKSWKSIMISQALSPQMVNISLTGSIDWPQVTNEFELLAMLRMIGSMASTEPQGSSRRYSDVLISWQESYRHSPAFHKRRPALMMLWHFIFMTLHMNADMLESYCGREGPNVAEKHSDAVRTWAMSNDATICIVHAVLVQRHFERITIGTEPPFHFPVCLYHCGLAWFCYTRFVNKAVRRAGKDVDLPELRMLDTNGTKSLLDGTIFMDGRPAASSLFRIIHLLQQANNWKLGHNLASTLLALVEDESDIL